MVEVPDEPGLLTVAAVEVKAKPATATSRVLGGAEMPPEAVASMVTAYFPGVALATVATVSVEVVEVVPEIVTVVGFNEQVGTGTAPLGPVIEQVRFTAPVKPPPGVTEMVLVPVEPAAMVEMLVPAIAMEGADLTVTVKDVEAVTFPVTASEALTATL
jgi:hypothetical protein